MLSVLYALLEGLSRELGIERTDIKGCLFRTYENGFMLYSLILYDAVAGGAGHVRRIVTQDGAILRRVLQRAYDVVNGCSCGSSCYKCLRNYFNQKIHDQLDRTKAAAFLRLWLGELNPAPAETETEAGNAEADASASELTPEEDFGINMRESAWKDIWKTVAGQTAGGTEERQRLESIAGSAELFAGKEKPYYDCEFTANGEDCFCDLLWPKSRVLFFTSENRESYEAATAAAWRSFYAGDGDLTAQLIADALKEE